MQSKHPPQQQLHNSAQNNSATSKPREHATQRWEIQVVKFGNSFYFAGLHILRSLWSSNFDSLVIWAAGVTWQQGHQCLLSLSQIKLHQEGHYIVNPRLIQVEREPRRLPCPPPAQSRSQSRMLRAVSLESWVSPGTQTLQPVGNARLCSFKKTPHASCTSTYQTHLNVQTLYSAHKSSQNGPWSQTGGRKPDADRAYECVL